MTAIADLAPGLREIVLDALSDAYWSRRANIEECAACTRQPTGICPEHQDDSDLARTYEDARKQIEGSVVRDAREIASLFPAEGGTE